MSGDKMTHNAQESAHEELKIDESPNWSTVSGYLDYLFSALIFS